MFRPSELITLAITTSTSGISFATLRDLAPRPASPSRNIFGLSKSSQKAEYAKIEKSRVNFAAGLKNAGSFCGTFSSSDFYVSRILVVPSVISTNYSSILCNRSLEFFLPITVNTPKK